jgi:3-oxoadipate enol-lactonase
MQRARIGDIEMAYRFDGHQEGPVVMLAHAMGTSARIWDQQVPALADRYRLLRYDWRGHGHTHAPRGPYSLGGFVQDAIGLMDFLDLPSVHWVGISTGGMIGQGLGIQHPQRIASLTLCNTTSRADQWYREWVAERQSVVRREGMQAVWQMTRHLWFTEPFIARADAHYRLIQSVFENTSPAGYLGGTSAVTELAYDVELHKIDAPTRIIAAGADPVTPLAKSEAIHAAIKDSTLHVIDGQHHFSNVEVPHQFNALLREGLDLMSIKQP